MTSAQIGKIALNSELHRILFDDAVEASKLLEVSLSEINEIQYFFKSPDIQNYTEKLHSSLLDTHHKGFAAR